MPALGHRAGALRCRARTHDAWLLRARPARARARTWQRAARRRLVLARACEPLRHAWRGAASIITMARPVCQGRGAAHSAAQGVSRRNALYFRNLF